MKHPVEARKHALVKRVRACILGPWYQCTPNKTKRALGNTKGTAEAAVCTAAYLWNMGKVVARKRMS